MSVHEVFLRPSKEDLLSYFAEKFERQGLFPSGEECVPAVQEKLDKEAITLPVHNLQMYIDKVGTNGVPGQSLKNTLTEINFIYACRGKRFSKNFNMAIWLIILLHTKKR